jgi:hypothetical protein
MTESDTPFPAEPPAPIQRPRVTKSVGAANLELRTIRLDSLICTLVSSNAEVYAAEIVKPDCKGELVGDSMDEDGFRARVSWSLGSGGLAVTGAHILTFSVGTPPFEESDAKYYSEINSVILAYPYIRQIIEDLSVKCLGRNLMISTLDVPRFVQERMKALMESSRPQEPASQLPASVNGDEDN